MFDTVVIATDGSTSARRAVRAALDLADRFEAVVHALYVVDAGEVAGSPADVRAEFEDALAAAGERALTFVREAAAGDGSAAGEGSAAGDGSAAGGETAEVVTVVREGDPVGEICRYAAEIEADVVVTGTRGRHGEHGFVLGSVAEGVVRRCSTPVLTVRQLEAGADTETEARDRRPGGVER